MAKRGSKTSAKRSTKRSAPKNSLVANINKRKKAHKSRSKKDSTVSPEAYQQMEAGWPKKKSAKKKSAKKASKTSTTASTKSRKSSRKKSTSTKKKARTSR